MLIHVSPQLNVAKRNQALVGSCNALKVEMNERPLSTPFQIYVQLQTVFAWRLMRSVEIFSGTSPTKEVSNDIAMAH